MYNLSEAYYQGLTDGYEGMPKDVEGLNYQAQVDYMAGYEQGEAQRTAEFDPMSEEERRLIYGDERDQT